MKSITLVILIILIHIASCSDSEENFIYNNTSSIPIFINGGFESKTELNSPVK